MKRLTLLAALLLASCDSHADAPPEPVAAPLHETAPDPRDEQALKDWERIGGDPAPFFLHHYPAPDKDGAYPVTEEQREAGR